MSTDSTLKSKGIARERQRARERKQNRTGFTARNYLLKLLFAWVLLPTAIVMSVGTESFNYYNTWASGIDESWRWLPVIAFAGIVNATVIMMGKGAVDDFQDGALSGKAFDKAAFTVKLLLFGLAFWWSVSQSLAGAPLMRTHMQETRRPVAALLANPDDVDARYAERRQQQLDIIRAARNTTWKGNITAAAMKTLRAGQAELAKIDDAIAAERAAVATANEGITEEYNADLAADSEQAYYIMAGGQVTLLICTIFIGLWYTGVEDEAGEAETEEEYHPSASAGASVYHPTAPAAAAGYRPPGFKHYAAPAPLSVPSTAPAPAPPSVPSSAPAPVATPPVATGSYKEIEEDAAPPDARTALNAFRTNQKNLKVYQARTSPAAQRQVARYEAQLQECQALAARHGLYIDFEQDPRPRYYLRPLA